MRKIWVMCLLCGVLASGLTGCTVFGEKNPPTLKSTTSAEQYERILWGTVKAKKWEQVPGLLAANVQYSVPGKVLGKDQVIPYLQSANVSDFTITGMTVKPNGPDMTLTYSLQVSSPGGAVQNYNVISVWQQVAKSLILIVHTEQPATVTP